MDALHDRVANTEAAGTLLLMLPGATHKPQDLIDAGLVAAVREHRLCVDVVICDAHVGYYLDRSIVEHLEVDILAHAGSRAYERVWLLGISLGGLGALLYARKHRVEIAGVVVLAPYLGVPGLMDEVARAGGFDQWEPGAIGALDDERNLLAWLKAQDGAVALPPTYLGYGLADRFAPASRLLAQRLPRERVLTHPGAHDWATWLALWKGFLDLGLLARSARARA